MALHERTVRTVATGRDHAPGSWRRRAGLACDIMMTMYEGDRVHVTGGPTSVDGYDWYHVTYQGTDGYAAGAYLVRAD